MDTIVLERPQAEKTATSATGICIALCLLFTQNLFISAKDLGNITGITPELNYLIKEQKCSEEIFEQEISDKYKNFQITTVDKGIKHISMTKYYSNRPVRINIVETSTVINKELMIEPAIASKTLASRTKITKIADRENALVAINGGYFKPDTGMPLGTLMINKQFYTGPIYDRVAMGIFDNSYDMARIQLNSEIKTNRDTVKIDNINQPRMLSTHIIVYTKSWGEYTPPSPKYGIQIAVRDGKIINYSESVNKIPNDGFVIVGPKSKLEKLKDSKTIKLNIETNPKWDNVNHIISGGPYLVKNGEVYVDINEERLTAIGGRNPRTAIGYTKDNHLIMVAADGREGASIGLTLHELAYLMKELGCINAMNLDGGGSTVMYVNGKIVNKPSVQGGIPLSHTLIIRKNYRLSEM